MEPDYLLVLHFGVLPPPVAPFPYHSRFLSIAVSYSISQSLSYSQSSSSAPNPDISRSPGKRSSSNMFAHENFEPYRLSIKFLIIANRIIERLPRGNAHLRDQLKRAATSVPLNIAEGSGKVHKLERLRFYSIARGSAMECAAICDVVSIIDDSLSVESGEAKELLESITKILTVVCNK